MKNTLKMGQTSHIGDLVGNSTRGVKSQFCPWNRPGRGWFANPKIGHPPDFFAYPFLIYWRWKKGEHHEYNRTCAHPAGPGRCSLQHIDRPRWMDTASRNKLLVADVRKYGNNHFFSDDIGGRAPSFGNPNCRNGDPYSFSSQTGCALAGRSRTSTHSYW